MKESGKRKEKGWRERREKEKGEREIKQRGQRERIERGEIQGEREGEGEEGERERFMAAQIIHGEQDNELDTSTAKIGKEGGEGCGEKRQFCGAGGTGTLVLVHHW